MGRLNKSAIDGYTYRSPGQTNAKDLTPNLREDVIASQESDFGRIKRGLDTAGTRPQNRTQVQNAAGRGITRTLGRAGAGQAAFEAGYEAGKALDESTGIGKKLVEKSGLGSAADKLVNRRDRVELSKESKDRLEDEEVDKTVRGVMAREKAGEFSPSRGDSESMKKGGKVKGWGIARGARVAKMR